MKSTNRLIALSALLLFSPNLLAASLPAALPDLLAEASRGGRYATPAPDETARAEALFGQLLAGKSPNTLAAELSALALEVVPLDPKTLIVRESAGALRGRGFYVLRPGQSGETLLVPHAFKDLLTREIGLHLFAEGQFAAAAWNTVPRWTDESGGRLDADLAHLPDSYFTAFTRAVGRHSPKAQVLQIHGFEGGKRKSDAASGRDIIVSNGTQQSGSQIKAHARCLASTLRLDVGVYPDSVRELGGTTNVQGKALRELGHAGFVHLEMNAPLRRKLADDAPTRRAWLDCLQGAR